MLYGIEGFLAFPLSLAFGIGVAIIPNVGLIGLVAGLVIWIFILRSLYIRVGLREPSRVIGATLISTILFFVGEFFGGGALILYGGGLFGESSGGIGTSGVILYPVLAIGLAVVFTRVLKHRIQPAVTAVALPAATISPTSILPENYQSNTMYDTHDTTTPSDNHTPQP